MNLSRTITIFLGQRCNLHRGSAHTQVPTRSSASEETVELSEREKSQFLSRGTIMPKGFDYAIEVYEVPWSAA